MQVRAVYGASEQGEHHELYFRRALRLRAAYRAPYHDGEHERDGLQCGGLADEQRLEHVLAHLVRVRVGVRVRVRVRERMYTFLSDKRSASYSESLSTGWPIL